MPEAFAIAVRELAVIPRYFRLCVQLRERLASLQHLNKQVLLWADLRDKLARRDPQIAKLDEELRGNPEEILASLARKVGWPGDGQHSVATEELQRSFPNFLNVRTDLTEQRIVLDAAFDLTKLSSDHVVLGWALVLQRLAKQHATEATDQLRERLLRELEPAASNDDKVRAVHAAALLVFLEESQNVVATLTVRATLLSLWIVHHNAAVNNEALKFFVQNDLMAYARAIEVLFHGYPSGNIESALIAPLALMWRDRAGDTGALRKILERWLRLIYPGDASGSEKKDESPPARFVVAESPEQLRLSYAAISAISFRPDYELLPALVDCNYSSDFCYVDVGTGERDQRFPIKHLFDPLGVLLRWSYTEEAIPHLQVIAPTLSVGREEAKSFLWFARLLRMAKLPSEIGEVEDVYIRGSLSLRQEVEDFRQWLGKKESSRHVSLGFGSLEGLAVRRNLPPLEGAEVESLCAEVQRRVTSGIVAATHQGTMENREFDDLLPWLARYAPSEFEKVWGTLWHHAIVSNNPVSQLFNLRELLPPNDPESRMVQAILSNANILLSQGHFDASVGGLTELILLHGNLDQLMEWLRLLQDRELSRNGGPVVGLLPLPKAIVALAPAGLAEKARHEFEEAITQSKANPDEQKLKVRARHWLAIYSYVAEPSEDVCDWALSLLTGEATDQDFRFSVFLLLTGCRDSNVFWRALEHPALQEYHFGYNAWRWARRFTRDTWPSLTFAALKGKTSLTVSGWLLHCAELDDELRKWGKEIAQAALEALDVDASHVAPKTKIKFQVDETGNLGVRSFESHPFGGSTMHSVMSSAWGVDRAKVRPSRSQADLDTECDMFRKDIEKLRASPRRDFTEFNALGPLFHWSKLEPDVFERFADQFLARLRQKDLRAVIDLSFFASAVAHALLLANPVRAIQLRERSTPGMLQRVLVFRGAFAWETEAIWSSDLNKSEEVATLRRRLLIDAPNDEELMWHVVAAEDGGNTPEIVRMAVEYLAAPVARDRALGVTLLAFQGDAESLVKLAKQRDSDASLWVREHATWAWEVCAQEQVCRQRYRETLQAKTLSELAAGLAELRNAFTPKVWSWHRRLEVENNGLQANGRMTAYLNLFWYHWGSVSSRKENIALFGRNLRDHCRGEQLKDGVTSRQWPWWQLQ